MYKKNALPIWHCPISETEEKHSKNSSKLELRSVLLWSKKAYSLETKLACIEMKKAGKASKVIMETLGIHNKSQVYTWWKWFQNDELYRFHQPIGKQYGYGKGMEELSELDQLRLQVKLLKKYRSLTRNSIK